MTTHHYKYHHPDNTPKKSITVRTLAPKDNAGHGDHWAIVHADSQKLHSWLKSSLDNARVPQGLHSAKKCDDYLVVGENTSCHIKQIFGLDDGKPARIVNMFPAVDSPYGLECKIDEIIACADSQDAILRLTTPDGTIIYAFDQLYAINHCHYEANHSYYVNFSAWAYSLEKSNQDEVILVDDPKAIRYHRAFNDIVAKNNGQVPNDIDEKIRAWQAPDNEPLAPVEINLGHSCIYLFGETFGQEDEAWCQGQVLGKSSTQFFDQEVILFDVVILREPDAKPFVVRIATLANETTHAIEVHDYIQANIWLQGAIFAQTQK